ncbi:MAG: HlyD family efflux transporter periplasmic adaptor subunit [Bacteroidetes bacterium]|nr:HlyD family efflux transporter periplasmic adaptor subunit [Bacteroidota bacterium]
MRTINNYFLLLIILFASACSTKIEKDSDSNIFIAKRDTFKVLIKTTGELQAENYTKIVSPSGLLKIDLYNIKLIDIVPEGTVVDSGDYVATLDISEINSKLIDAESELSKFENEYKQTKIDTAISQGNSRVNLIDLKTETEEKQIALKQSEYETPATKRQLELDYEKSERKYKREIINFKLRTEQENNKVKIAFGKLQKQKKRRDEIIKTKDEFIIKAPNKGMVIYKKNRDGSKRQIESTISPWDPIVALLPDLTKMICKTYINEIDINKVSPNQKVIINVDAFPDKKYTGKILSVANIGENIQGSSIKAFEVLIKLIQIDSLLKPAMTTSNTIISKTVNNVISIPIDAIFYKNNIKCVYKKNKKSIVKTKIETGITNEDFIIVEKGIKHGDKILLYEPDV